MNLNTANAKKKREKNINQKIRADATRVNKTLINHKAALCWRLYQQYSKIFMKKVYNIYCEKKQYTVIKIQADFLIGSFFSITCFSSFALITQAPIDSNNENNDTETTNTNTPQSKSDLTILVDFSGSMNAQIFNESKDSILKNALNNETQNISPSIPVALWQYGANFKKDQKKESCQDATELVPLGTNNAAQRSRALEALHGNGYTALTESLYRISDVLNKHQTSHHHILIIADGKDNCLGNPLDAINYVESQNPGTTIHTIGFDIDQEGEEQLHNIAQKTGGSYTNVFTKDKLEMAIAQVVSLIHEQSPDSEQQPATNQPPLPVQNKATLTQEENPTKEIEPEIAATVIEAGTTFQTATIFTDNLLGIPLQFAQTLPANAFYYINIKVVPGDGITITTENYSKNSSIRIDIEDEDQQHEGFLAIPIGTVGKQTWALPSIPYNMSQQERTLTLLISGNGDNLNNNSTFQIDKFDNSDSAAPYMRDAPTSSREKLPSIIPKRYRGTIHTQGLLHTLKDTSDTFMLTGIVKEKPIEIRITGKENIEHLEASLFDNNLKLVKNGELENDTVILSYTPTSNDDLIFQLKTINENISIPYTFEYTNEADISIPAVTSPSMLHKTMNTLSYALAWLITLGIVFLAVTIMFHPLTIKKSENQT